MRTRYREREEDQVREMGAETHISIESAPDEEPLQGKEESIIRPKRRAGAGSFGQKWICAGNTLS